MELYEVMIIINPELEKEEHEEVLNGLSATITKNKGKVDTILDWRKRRLAYEIDKKYQEGHYYLVYFSAQGTIIPEIEHYFKVTDGVIRYMIVRTDEQEFEAAAKKAADEAAAAEKAAAEEAAAEESAAEESAAEESAAEESTEELSEDQDEESTEEQAAAEEPVEEPTEKEEKNEQEEVLPETENTGDPAGEDKPVSE